jgi:hypothetical protein
MTRLIFLLEEQSMKVLLDRPLPRLFPDLAFLCVPHEGKQDLEKSIPRKLRAWREPGVRYCILRDNDGGDCRALKSSLTELCRHGGRDDVLVRIACQELEAWYFGDTAALAEAFEDSALRALERRQRFRDPDAIDQPSKALLSYVPAFQKISGARRMGERLDWNNRSSSFRALLEGVVAMGCT